MLLFLKPTASQAEIDAVTAHLVALGHRPHHVNHASRRQISVPTTNELALAEFSAIERTVRVTEPWPLVARAAEPFGTVVRVHGPDGEVAVGDGGFVVMAGPCAVEDRDQLAGIAHAVRAAGARVLRGGAFKPRTSPYAFQGLGTDGLELLAEARQATRMPVVSEIMDARDLDAVVEHVDLLQVGSRNMQNFTLLKALGGAGKPVLLKRGFAATIQELLLAAEYVVASGNPHVILCERGIRTFEPALRNTLDLGSVALIKRLSHLPIIVDPSHATGDYRLVAPLARAALAVGADGLLVEVHDQPERARCDGAQSIRPDRFTELVASLRTLAVALGREL
jgi:3-deoxy-7-phosphoheptulonate synthase